MILTSAVQVSHLLRPANVAPITRTMCQNVVQSTNSESEQRKKITLKTKERTSSFPKIYTKTGKVALNRERIELLHVHICSFSR